MAVYFYNDLPPNEWTDDYISKHFPNILIPIRQNYKYIQNLQGVQKDIKDMWGYNLPTYGSVSRISHSILDIKKINVVMTRLGISNINDFANKVIEISTTELRLELTPKQKKINDLPYSFLLGILTDKNNTIQRYNHYKIISEYVNKGIDFNEFLGRLLFNPPMYNKNMAILEERYGKEFALELKYMTSEIIQDFIKWYSNGGI